LIVCAGLFYLVLGLFVFVYFQKHKFYYQGMDAMHSGLIACAGLFYLVLDVFVFAKTTLAKT